MFSRGGDSGGREKLKLNFTFLNLLMVHLIRCQIFTQLNGSETKAAETETKRCAQSWHIHRPRGLFMSVRYKPISTHVNNISVPQTEHVQFNSK